MKIMMTFKYIYALMTVVLFATACQDDELIKQPNNPAAIGDEIVFGARAGFENSNPKSRTVYSGDTYTVNGKTFERIDWVDGTDMIEIYCEGASNGPKAHYTVNHWKDHDTQKDYAYLTRKGDSSLQWGDGVDDKGTHNFYAMYPSSQMFTTDQSTLAQGILMDETQLTGVIPTSQSPISIIPDDEGNYVAAPDMKYAYMAAKTSATRFDTNGEQNGISLTFVPVVTAVQIQLTVPETVSSGTGTVVPVSIGEIQVVGTGIAGTFTADWAGWTDFYPTCTNQKEGGADVIQISTWKENKPITLAAGKSLTFTVFLRPGVNVSELQVRISPTGAGYVGKSLTNVTIPKNLKTVIKDLELPATGVEIDASKWMSQLPSTMTMKKLSLPGTGGTFSYNYNSSNPGWYKQQKLTLDEQWEAGIRAFEIVSDRPLSLSDDYTSRLCGNLKDQQVLCNGTNMGITVYEVLTDLLSKVSSIGNTITDSNGKETLEPTECAVLILTYQPRGGLTDIAKRHADCYAASLRKMYENDLTLAQKQKIIKYTPDLTIGTAAGNIMILCRINQKDESESGSFSRASEILAGTNITLIDGCGTGKDRWGSRGYTVQNNVAYDAAHTDDAKKSVDYWMQQGDEYFNNVKTPIDLNFKFGTNDQTITCWYQEWARVVNLDSLNVKNSNYYEVNGTRWYESYSEKLNDVEKTFEMAISDKYPSYIFINSLCGYLVDQDISSSYTIFTGGNTGGMAGNIEGLANTINPAFYQYVLNAGMEQTTGPTGIVMMDYVASQPDANKKYDGSYYLPGVIIANNFKFTSGNTTGGSGDTNNPGEGGEQEGM